MPPAASFLKKAWQKPSTKKVNARRLVLENGLDFDQCPSAIVLQVKCKVKRQVTILTSNVLRKQNISLFTK